jgi:hypothetical protein
MKQKSKGEKMSNEKLEELRKKKDAAYAVYETACDAAYATYDAARAARDAYYGAKKEYKKAKEKK